MGNSGHDCWCEGCDLISGLVAQVFGAARALAMFSGCIAVGTASGVIFVLMPRSINPADGKATGWVVLGTNRLLVLLLESSFKGMHIIFVFLVGSHY